MAGADQQEKCPCDAVVKLEGKIEMAEKVINNNNIELALINMKLKQIGWGITTIGGGIVAIALNMFVGGK